MTDQNPLVDYETNAARYRQGRELTPAQLEQWRLTVSTRLPHRPLDLVIDAGAGTGAFFPMWRQIGAKRILAVDPSTAMRSIAASRTEPIVEIADGTLTDIPASSGSADAVWASAVLHHAPDLLAALAEASRVLRPGGRLLVRGFFPDTSRVPWLEHFPGADHARARFPSVEHVAPLIVRTGLRIIDITNVVDTERPERRTVISWIKAMRQADTLLTALTDTQITQGIASIESVAEPELEPVELTLLTTIRE